MKNRFLSGKTAEKIYESVKALPIVDYHCHLSPREIFEDRKFDNIGEMWLSGDHYKWRLMRNIGTDEHFITGSSTWYEKFCEYARALSLAPGNPLHHWSHLELSMFFGIDAFLSPENAEAVWNKANSVIAAEKLSPRKLIERSGVDTICTTDDPTDTLEWHKKISEDKSVGFKVLPSFRADNLLLVRRSGYKEYIAKLASVTDTVISDIDSFKTACKKDIARFIKQGCRFTDIGIPYFPTHIASDYEADSVFKRAVRGAEITDDEYSGFLGNMYIFLAEEYFANGLVMQLHLSVIRNANTVLYDKLGADCGVDCVGDAVTGKELTFMLDAMLKNGGLPRTVIYTLNESNAAQIASVCSAFPSVIPGAAWWFCDHRRGIENELDVIAENGALGMSFGMLTDSRSFLSYARHDYFRRILSSKLAKWCDSDEIDINTALKIAQRVCYYNIKEIVGE